MPANPSGNSTNMRRDSAPGPVAFPRDSHSRDSLRETAT
ncbi:Protein of unknown function [Gryllus bimaculatus]|nr:Protein of unknown function [Gryllus bimaculatus]